MLNGRISFQGDLFVMRLEKVNRLALPASDVDCTISVFTTYLGMDKRVFRILTSWVVMGRVLD